MKSIVTVAFGTTLSRIVGFIRDILIARFLGASMMADAFFVALRFPNLFRSLFAEGTLNVAFVPILSGIMQSQGEKKARVFARNVFSFLFYILLFFTILVEIFMPNFMFVLAPGFEEIPGKLALTTTLSRITFPFLIFVSLVSLFAGMLNAKGKFWAAAFTPTILNLTMIGSLFAIRPFLDTPYAPAYALSIGVLTAGVIEFAFLFWHLKKNDFLIGLVSPFKALFNLSKEVKILLKKMLPGVLGSGVYQINLFFDTFLVSFVGAGAISWLNYAHHLFQLPVGIIGTAIGTALLPILSKYIKAGEIEKANEQVSRSLELSVAMSTASMVGLMLLSEPIVRILFERGMFTSLDSVNTAWALIVFAVGLPAYMLTKTLSPFFFAKGDTKTPVQIAITGVILNILFALVLMQFMGYLGIALATGITVWINAFQYIVRLYKQGDLRIDNLCKYRLKRILFSTLLMAIFIVGMKSLFNHFFVGWQNENGLLSILLLSVLIGFAMIVFSASIIMFKGILIKDIKKLIRR